MAVPVSTTIQTQIANLYIAILGRNPEPTGFGYWCDTLANNGGTQSALNAITVGFGKSPEFVATYGGQTTSAAITLMYNNVLNRAPDATGLTYWTTQYNAYLAQGNEVSAALALTGNAIITAAAANTGTADQTNIQAKEAAAIAAGTTAPSTTVALTTGIDTLTIGSNTTVVGVVASTTPSTTTLNPGDTITGNGTGNILRVVDSSTGNAAAIAGVTMSGVQTLAVQAVGTTAASVYNLATITGVTTVQSANSASAGALGVTFQGLAAGTTVSVSGAASTAGNVTSFTYATPTSAVAVNLNGGLTTAQLITNVGGTATTATISSTGGVNGVAVDGTAAPAVIRLTGAAGNTVTSLTVNAATNMRATLTAGDYSLLGADLVVSGAATSVHLGTAGIYKTINASGLTAGGVTVNASTTLTSFTGGAGNDTLTNTGVAGLNAANIATTATIDAGAGVDTFSTSLIRGGNGAVFKNFEQLAIAGQGVEGVVGNNVIDASLLSNSTITGVVINGAWLPSAAAPALSGLSNLVETATGFNVTVSGSATAITDGYSIGFKASSITGTTDVININFTENNAAAATLAGTLTITGIETANINSGGTAKTGLVNTNSVALTDNNLASVVVTGANSTTVAVTDQVTVGTATLSALTLVDASAATGRFTYVESADATSAAAVVKGSAGVDNITVTTHAAVAVSTGSATTTYGQDTVTLNGGADVLNVGGASVQVATSSAATTTVTDLATGDSLAFSGPIINFVTSAVAGASTALNLGAALTAIATAANAASAGTELNVAYGVYAGNTYVLFDAGSDGFSTTDQVVKLTGVVDLSNATIVGGNLVA